MPFNDWDLEPFDQTHVFFNTYERDWAKSYKDFGTGTTANNSYYLAGRARYNSDYYTFNPLEPLPRIDMAYIHQHWAEWFESVNGNFRLWRVD